MFTLLEHPDAHTKDVPADKRVDMATVATQHHWQQSHCNHSPTPLLPSPPLPSPHG